MEYSSKEKIYQNGSCLQRMKQKHIAVKATGFKQRASNSIVTAIIREMMKKKTDQKKKPQTRTLKEKTTTFFRYNDLRGRNTVQTFKIVILRLGNSASNKNTFNKSHFLSTRNNMLAFFFLPIIRYCSVRDNTTKNY